MRDPDTPKGTIALLLVYLIFIFVLWGNAYITVLLRGANQ